MKKKITIVDYGLGNIRAFYNVYKTLDIPSKLVSSCNELFDVDKIILPGVGSFDSTMNNLKGSGVLEILKAQVLVNKKYILGICIGMQLLAD